LAYLLIFALTNDYEILNDILTFNPVITNEVIENVLKPIKDTKLYWLIKRCLERDPEKRILMLI
jgi:hypothetical protein